MICVTPSDDWLGVLHLDRIIPDNDRTAELVPSVADLGLRCRLAGRRRIMGRRKVELAVANLGIARPQFVECDLIV